MHIHRLMMAFLLCGSSKGYVGIGLGLVRVRLSMLKINLGLVRVS
jgi:hypothetical protein